MSLDSHHPVSAKRSTVSALLSRALSVVSDSTEQTAELDVVKSTLLKNGYPAAFIDSELARLRGKKGKQQPVLSERDDSCSTTVVIPFVDKTTQAIQRVLRPLRIRVVGRPCQWKWSLQNGLKDSIDPQEDTGVVYAINCRDCEAAYIGETGRTTNVRVAEHLAHARHGRVDLSAAADHAIARMQNKLCDVTKCLTTVAAGVLSGRDRKKKLETGLLFEVLLLDQQISFGVRLFFVTRCPHVPLVTCQKAQT